MPIKYDLHSSKGSGVLGRGLCIIQGLTDMRKVGAFAASVINNFRYWPRHVPRQEIDNYTNTKDIEDFASLCDKLDDYNYDIFA